MATSDNARASFGDADRRADEMHRTIETWLRDLIDDAAAARESAAFQHWLDVYSRFPSYSVRNTLLIAHQAPEATRVAGYRTWQTEFGRQVKRGETAIWIWAPLRARKCPDCGNSVTYHERSGCSYDETTPEEWSVGVVGFKPVPVFDVAQTEGEPLPALETGARGDASGVVARLVAAAEGFDVGVEVVPAEEWAHGGASGVCRFGSGATQTTVAVNAGLGAADRAVTLVHELAHALLHDGEGRDRAGDEVEAEAVAAVVGRYFGVDVSGSAVYVAAWAGEDASEIEERLERIAETARSVIGAVEGQRPGAERRR